MESKDQHVPSRGGMLIHTNPSSSQFWPVTFEMAGNIDQQKPRESDEMHWFSIYIYIYIYLFKCIYIYKCVFIYIKCIYIYIYIASRRSQMKQHQREEWGCSGGLYPWCCMGLRTCCCCCCRCCCCCCCCCCCIES